MLQTHAKPYKYVFDAPSFGAMLQTCLAARDYRVYCRTLLAQSRISFFFPQGFIACHMDIRFMELHLCALIHIYVFAMSYFDTMLQP
jgi:hypothetical protein